MIPIESSTPPPHHTPTFPHLFSHYPAQPPPAAVRMVVTPAHPCPYLPDRTAQNRAFWAEEIPADLYHRFMDAGFRRSGKVVYQPVCGGCRTCRPIRVPVDRFTPSKSQRRSWRRNSDLVVTTGAPAATDENFDLYRRYVAGWHGKDKSEEDRDSFEAFLYHSPVETIEYSYRDRSGVLLAVGICDVSAGSLSSVYFYYDPDVTERSIGTFGALYEIEEARRMGIPYYYLGYWVDGCRTMQYKNGYRPNEVLDPDGVWRTPGEMAGDAWNKSTVSPVVDRD